MNLLEETINQLKRHEKTFADVLWIGGNDFSITKDNFIQLAASAEYDCGYGSQEVADDLKIVGDDWWLERHEYDGAESWVFKKLPKKPIKEMTITALTIHQKEGDPCGWCILLELNTQTTNFDDCEDDQKDYYLSY